MRRDPVWGELLPITALERSSMACVSRIGFVRCKQRGEWISVAFFLVAIVPGTNIQTPRFKELAVLVIDGITAFWASPGFRFFANASVTKIACVQLKAGEIAWTMSVVFEYTHVASFRTTAPFDTFLTGTSGSIFALHTFLSSTIAPC